MSRIWSNETDPLGDFKITKEWLVKIAKKLWAINKPTLIVQEGGYDLGNIWKYAETFIAEIEKTQEKQYHQNPKHLQKNTWKIHSGK